MEQQKNFSTPTPQPRSEQKCVLNRNNFGRGCHHSMTSDDTSLYHNDAIVLAANAHPRRARAVQLRPPCRRDRPVMERGRGEGKRIGRKTFPGFGVLYQRPAQGKFRDKNDKQTPAARSLASSVDLSIMKARSGFPHAPGERAQPKTAGALYCYSL